MEKNTNNISSNRVLRIMAFTMEKYNYNELRFMYDKLSLRLTPIGTFLATIEKGAYSFMGCFPVNVGVIMRLYPPFDAFFTPRRRMNYIILLTLRRRSGNLSPSPSLKERGAGKNGDGNGNEDDNDNDNQNS